MSKRVIARLALLALCVMALAACAQPAPPTNTPMPPSATTAPTSTPIPPTATVAPSNTPIPPTAVPTNTPVPPTATAAPTATPTPSNIPSGRWQGAMAYDSESGKVLLFAGWSVNTSYTPDVRDIWALDVASGSWERVGDFEPTAHSFFAAYDAESDRVILVDAISGYNTWTYDYNQRKWTKMPNRLPIPGLGNRPLGIALAYDAESDRIIAFGGRGSGSLSNETWAYDYNHDAWTEMNPKVSPPARNQACMVYDSQADRVIMWSGEFAALGDFDARVWAYDYNTDAWTALEPKAGPPALWDAGMAYDVAADRLIVFGGFTPTTDSLSDVEKWPRSDETWAYNYHANSWTKLSPAVRPPARDMQRMVYDSRAGKVVFFGGDQPPKPVKEVRDTWAYDGKANSWTEIKPKP